MDATVFIDDILGGNLPDPGGAFDHLPADI